MTTYVDRLFISLGVEERELTALDSRGVAYLGLAAIAGLSICLMAGIASNLVGAIV